MDYSTYSRVGKYSDLEGKKDRAMYRFFEILPGLLTWLTLILIVILSFKTPVFIAIFVILFDIYWLIKTIYLSMHMRSSFLKMRENMKKDWRRELELIGNLPAGRWQELYHLVILPMYREPISIVRESFNSLIKANYPLDKLIVVLTAEEKGGEVAIETSQTIKNEFGDKFLRFMVTVHPNGIPGEMAGKGSNETWAIKQVKSEVVDKLGIDYEKIIVSVFDADSVVYPSFFSCLSWNFLTAEKPLRSSFQPIPLYINNIWEAPAFARIFAFSTTFWQMIQQSRPEQLVTFSSQSISFKALVDVGFWQENVVSEDSRIFWQCLLRYDGDWRTVPMYFPLNMDANVAPTFWQTLKNQYRQIRRWHYGVENNPYFQFGFLKNKNIPKRKKWYFNWTMIEKTHSSATNPIIIFLLGWLPIFVGGSDFNRTVLSLNLPNVTSAIMQLAMVGLISSAVISVVLLPPKPPEYGRFKWAWMVLQWVLFPVNFILFGALPAIDAQTRLMFGKYLGFWVTPKIRNNPETRWKH